MSKARSKTPRMKETTCKNMWWSFIVLYRCWGNRFRWKFEALCRLWEKMVVFQRVQSLSCHEGLERSDTIGGNRQCWAVQWLDKSLMAWHRKDVMRTIIHRSEIHRPLSLSAVCLSRRRDNAYGSGEWWKVALRKPCDDLLSNFHHEIVQELSWHNRHNATLVRSYS